MAGIATDFDAGLQIIGLHQLRPVAVVLSVSVTADFPLGGAASQDVVVQARAVLEVALYQFGA